MIVVFGSNNCHFQCVSVCVLPGPTVDWVPLGALRLIVGRVVNQVFAQLVLIN